jgi:hypothetical protein
MLYRLHNDILIVGLLTICFLAALSSGKAFSLITPFTVVAYLTQLLLLMSFSRDMNASYSDKTMFVTVLVYGLVLSLLTIILAHYYNGDKFLFEDPDAVFYYKEGIKSADIGLIENAARIIRLYDFDDWGALLVSCFLMYFIPSPFFMNAFYVFIGAVSAVFLYRIGKYFMPEVYAFLASLAYSTSSYLILFHCTFLKESFFVFLVISAIYYFYRSIEDKNHLALIMVFFSVFSVFFYRPPLVAFFMMAYIAYYAITQRGTALSVFMYIMIAIGMVGSIAFMQSQVETYTEGGNTDELLLENGSANYSGGFNFFVGWFVAFLGPFPTLFPMEGADPKLINFFGAGLTYKAFIAIPFWVGLYWAIKRFEVVMIPMVVFAMAEILAAAYILASFELRKVLLHVPFMYIMSFYGLYQLENNKVNKTFVRYLTFSYFAFAIGVLVLWNLIRVK